MYSLCVRRMLAICACLCVLQTGAASEKLCGQDRPPVVSVEFEVADSLYIANMDVEPIEQIESTVSRRLAKLSERYFKFLRWSHEPQSGSVPDPAARLKVSLVGKPQPVGSEIELAFAATVGGKQVDLPHISNKRIYRSFDEQHAHAPSLLQADVLDSLEVQFRNESFRAHLQKQFLRTIPLTRQVHVDRDNQRLVIPIPWDSLRASDESVLLVEFFVVEAMPEERTDGSLRLMPDGRATMDGVTGLTRCAILRFNFPPSLREEWDPRIPAVLSLAEEKVVFMEFYDPDTSPPGTQAGLVTDPERQGQQ